MRGVTLVELMVAIAIIGLLAAAVALTLPDDAAGFRRDAETFATHLGRARDEAILGMQDVQVQADAGGYATERRDLGGWRPLQAPSFAGIRPWSDGTHPLLPPEQERITFRFDPTGSVQPAELLLAHGTHRMRVRVDLGGKVELDAPQ